MMRKKPHAKPFPHVDRVDEIKAGYRKKQEEARAAEERAALERAREEEENRRSKEEEQNRMRDEDRERKARRPWRLASFVIGSHPQEDASNDVPESAGPLPTEKDRAHASDSETGSSGPDVEESLEAIYMEQGDAVPDLRRLEHRRSRRWFYALSGFLFGFAILAGMAWTGFFFFQPYREFQGEGLRADIRGPQTIALGREEAFEIILENRDAQPFERVEARLGLPNDFTVTSFDPPPSDQEMRLWKIDGLQSRESKSITVKGFFTGGLGTQGALQVIATYRPRSFARNAETVVTRSVSYQHTVLFGALTGPAKAVAGDTVVLRYAVGNNGSRTMTGFFARFHYPRGFVPVASSSSTEVDAVQSEASMPLPDIAPHATATAELAGAFVSGQAGDMVFRAEAGRRGADHRFLAAQKTETRVPVLAGDLMLRVVANGSDADRALLPGEPIRIAIGYQNTSPEPIRDVAITLGFESFVNGNSATGTSLLDWRRLDDALAGASTTKARVQTLRYDKKQVPAFGELAPQSDGTIELSVPSMAAASGTRDAWIRLTVQGIAPTVGGTKVNRTVRSQPISLRYRSDADVAAEARYFTEEGAPLGFGPLPPIAGKTTAYRVVWKIAKTLHALENVTVSAALPKIGAWSARTVEDAGTVSYDDASRTVRWSLDKIPEGTNEIEAGFELQLTPEMIDIGRFAALLGETKFEATDALLKEVIVRAKPQLSTDLQNDDGARGKGVVRKE